MLIMLLTCKTQHFGDSEKFKKKSEMLVMGQRSQKFFVRKKCGFTKKIKVKCKSCFKLLEIPNSGGNICLSWPSPI